MSHAHLPDVALTFLCPNCSYPIRAAASMAGRQSACPVCDKLVSVPDIPPIAQADAHTWPELPALGVTE